MPAVRRPGQHPGWPRSHRPAGRGERGRAQGDRRVRADTRSWPSSTTARRRSCASTPRRATGSTSPRTIWSGSAVDESYGRFVPAGPSSVPATSCRGVGANHWVARRYSRQDMAEAALAGWLQSDGFVGQYEGTDRSLTIEAMTVTALSARGSWPLSIVCFPRCTGTSGAWRPTIASLDCRRTRLYGDVLTDFVERWGLRSRGAEMTVPEHLFAAALPGRGLPPQPVSGRRFRHPEGARRRDLGGHDLRGDRPWGAGAAHAVRDLLPCSVQGGQA